MLDDLTNYKHNDKEKLFFQYVSERLDRSLRNYEKDLTLKYNSVLSYDDIDIVKNLPKEK